MILTIKTQTVSASIDLFLEAAADDLAELAGEEKSIAEAFAFGESMVSEVMPPEKSGEGLGERCGFGVRGGEQEWKGEEVCLGEAVEFFGGAMGGDGGGREGESWKSHWGEAAGEVEPGVGGLAGERDPTFAACLRFLLTVSDRDLEGVGEGDEVPFCLDDDSDGMAPFR